jgi:hypothetical protein
MLICRRSRHFLTKKLKKRSFEKNSGSGDSSFHRLRSSYRLSREKGLMRPMGCRDDAQPTNRLPACREISVQPGINPSPVGTRRYMNRYVSLFVLCLIAGPVFGMGSGTGGGGSGSSGGGTASGGGSNTPQIGEGGRAVRLYDQGVRAMNSKRFAEAQARFAQALTENPRFAEAHNYLGYSLQMEGTQNYLTALQHYNRAIQLKPNLAQADEYRGVLLLNMDRKSAAEKDLATLKTLNPGLAVELERRMKKGKEASGSVVKHGG